MTSCFDLLPVQDILSLPGSAVHSGFSDHLNTKEWQYRFNVLFSNLQV